MHEMSVFPELQSAFTRRPGADIDAALAAQMRWFARHAFNSSGCECHTPPTRSCCVLSLGGLQQHRLTTATLPADLYNRWDMMDSEQDPVRRTIIAGIWVAFFQRVPAIVVWTGGHPEGQHGDVRLHHGSDAALQSTADTFSISLAVRLANPKATSLLQSWLTTTRWSTAAI